MFSFHKPKFESENEQFLIIYEDECLKEVDLAVLKITYKRKIVEFGEHFSIIIIKTSQDN